MVAEGFQSRTLLEARGRQLDERLNQLAEERVAPNPARVAPVSSARARILAWYARKATDRHPRRARRASAPHRRRITR
jgi:hypothetical protein